MSGNKNGTKQYPNSHRCQGCNKEIPSFGRCYDCARPGKRMMQAASWRLTHTGIGGWGIDPETGLKRLRAQVA